MKLTPAQRRQRLYDLMGENKEFMKMKDACDPAKRWFDAFTAWFPTRLRDRIREYPGMMYFIHSRTIDTICKQMKFPDED